MATAAAAAPATPPPYAETVVIQFVTPLGREPPTLLFSNGTKHIMLSQSLLGAALHFRGPNGQCPNQAMAIDGDAQIQAVLCAQWRASDDKQISSWSELYSKRLATGHFQAQRCEQSSLITYMVDTSLSAEPPNQRELSTTLEALIGAVAQDCGYHHPTIERVMRGLGIYWPHSEAEKAELRRICP